MVRRCEHASTHMHTRMWVCACAQFRTIFIQFNYRNHIIQQVFLRQFVPKFSAEITNPFWSETFRHSNFFLSLRKLKPISLALKSGAHRPTRDGTCYTSRGCFASNTNASWLVSSMLWFQCVLDKRNTLLSWIRIEFSGVTHVCGVWCTTITTTVTHLFVAIYMSIMATHFLYRRWHNVTTANHRACDGFPFRVNTSFNCIDQIGPKCFHLIQANAWDNVLSAKRRKPKLLSSWFEEISVDNTERPN